MIGNVTTIAVIGAGTMGAGIAQLAASHGCTVHLIDVNAAVLEKARAEISKNLDRQVEKGKLNESERNEILHRIHAGNSIARLGDSLLIIEAVVENLDLKRRIFKELDSSTTPDAILATNTSSLSVTKIAEGVRNPSRVVGMHFFNPAPLMPLVEIIAARQSVPAVVESAARAARAWGKTTVLTKDTPGFIVNRVARGYYLEALRLLGEGVAGVDEIDHNMRTHGKFKMGPFQLMDLVGLDVNLSVSASVWEQMGKPARLTPHPIQQSLVSAGHLGRKSGRGFYAYEGDRSLPAVPVDRRSFTLSPLLSDAVRAFTARAGAENAAGSEPYVFTRILAAVLNEAGLARDEEIATPSDIDTAMIKGTNYPDGPLAWADRIGHNTVRGTLAALNDAAGDGRYAPARYFR